MAARSFPTCLQHGAPAASCSPAPSLCLLAPVLWAPEAGGCCPLLLCRGTPTGPIPALSFAVSSYWGLQSSS